MHTWGHTHIYMHVCMHTLTHTHTHAHTHTHTHTQCPHGHLNCTSALQYTVAYSSAECMVCICELQACNTFFHLCCTELCADMMGYTTDPALYTVHSVFLWTTGLQYIVPHLLFWAVCRYDGLYHSPCIVHCAQCMSVNYRPAIHCSTSAVLSCVPVWCAGICCTELCAGVMCCTSAVLSCVLVWWAIPLTLTTAPSIA